MCMSLCFLQYFIRIVQKKDRADGTGSELVNNVVVAAEQTENLSKGETG